MKNYNDLCKVYNNILVKLHVHLEYLHENTNNYKDIPPELQRDGYLYAKKHFIKHIEDFLGIVGEVYCLLNLYRNNDNFSETLNINKIKENMGKCKNLLNNYSKPNESNIVKYVECLINDEDTTDNIMYCLKDIMRSIKILYSI